MVLMKMSRKKPIPSLHLRRPGRYKKVEGKRLWWWWEQACLRTLTSRCPVRSKQARSGRGASSALDKGGGGSGWTATLVRRGLGGTVQRRPRRDASVRAV